MFTLFTRNQFFETDLTTTKKKKMLRFSIRSVIPPLVLLTPSTTTSRCFCSSCVSSCSSSSIRERIRRERERIKKVDSSTDITTTLVCETASQYVDSEKNIHPQHRDRHPSPSGAEQLDQALESNQKSSSSNRYHCTDENVDEENDQVQQQIQDEVAEEEDDEDVALPEQVQEPNHDEGGDVDDDNNSGDQFKTMSSDEARAIYQNRRTVLDAVRAQRVERQEKKAHWLVWQASQKEKGFAKRVARQIQKQVAQRRSYHHTVSARLLPAGNRVSANYYDDDGDADREGTSSSSSSLSRANKIEINNNSSSNNNNISNSSGNQGKIYRSTSHHQHRQQQKQQQQEHRQVLHRNDDDDGSDDDEESRRRYAGRNKELFLQEAKAHKFTFRSANSTPTTINTTTATGGDDDEDRETEKDDDLFAGHDDFYYAQFSKVEREQNIFSTSPSSSSSLSSRSATISDRIFVPSRERGSLISNEERWGMMTKKL